MCRCTSGTKVGNVVGQSLLERPRMSEAEISRRLLKVYRVLGVLDSEDDRAEAQRPEPQDREPVERTEQ